MSAGYEDNTYEHKQKKIELGLIYWCTIGMNFLSDIFYTLLSDRFHTNYKTLTESTINEKLKLMR